MKRTIFFLLILISVSVISQNTDNKYPKPIVFAAQEDYDNMMKQLGIKSLRPDSSANETSPNHANYDEALANSCHKIPDVLVLKNGKKVATANIWWKYHRPEII